jgi:hypothetical protein
MILGLLLVALAVPLSASQFVDLPFEQVAAEADYIVRGTVGQTWSAWDDAHEVIYTYATVKVSRYFGGTDGPQVLTVREVGGTVDGYTQEAVGFPAIRGGEEVVLMLAQWEDGADFRIHAFNQGKYLVRRRGGEDVLMPDLVRQGVARLERPDRGFAPRIESIDSDVPAMRLEEFASMVRDARGVGRSRETERIRE